MSKGKQGCWTRSPPGCCWDYFCQDPQGASGSRAGRYLCCRYPWLDHPGWAFPQGSLPAWLLWGLFCSPWRARTSPACQAYQPDPFVGLAPLASSSIYKQEQESSDSKAPFIPYNRGRILREQTALDSVCQLTLRSCPGGTSLPSGCSALLGRSSFFSLWK